MQGIEEDLRIARRETSANANVGEAWIGDNDLALRVTVIFRDHGFEGLP